MKKITLPLIILLLALSACGSAPDQTSSSSLSSPSPISENPVPSPLPTEANLYATQPADASLTRGSVFLEAKELRILESFPLQFILHLTGSLPTPCNQLRVAVGLPDSENKVRVDVYSISDPDKICTQVIKPFEVNIPLGSFPTGKYSLWVNGEMIAEFQS